MNRRKTLARAIACSKNIAFRDMIALTMADYHINNIFYSAEDEGYLADIPDLVACSAFRHTTDEALREVEKAKAAWLAAAHAEGKPIPAPRYRPVIYQLAS